MSVLIKLVKEREDYLNQRKVCLARHNHVKAAVELLMLGTLCLLPFLFVFWGDKMVLLIRNILQH